jgi:hypothetical protein
VSYSRVDYYEEGLAESFSEHGVDATPEQIRAIAKDVEGYSESIGLAFHQPADPSGGEVEELRKALDRERRKVICRECKGHGVVTFQGPHHGSTSTCFRCNGDGRTDP